MMAHVDATLSAPEFVSRLREDGFCKVPGLVPDSLVRAALLQINKQLGQPATAAGGVDRLKGKTFAAQPAISDLFNKSGIPLALARLLQAGTPGNNNNNNVRACVAK